jgi:hypothetical protein
VPGGSAGERSGGARKISCGVARFKRLRAQIRRDRCISCDVPPGTTTAERRFRVKSLLLTFGVHTIRSCFCRLWRAHSN